MSVKLLFITSEYFSGLTREALDRMGLPCETMVVPYRNFSGIGQIYRQYAEGYDACFVSGTSAKSAIGLSTGQLSGPLIPFQVGADALQRDILRLAVQKQSLDFSRIAIDFMIPLGSYSVSDYLQIADPAEVVPRTEEWMAAKKDLEGHGVEAYIRRRLGELWEEKAIDLVICQYSSLVPWLEERGIPWRCPFLAEDDLRKLIDETLMRIELNRLHNNHPAIIQAFPRQVALKGERLQRLSGLMNEFVRKNMIDCVVQTNDGCCILITSMQIIRFLTDNFQTCRISSYLEEHLEETMVVGYGVGTSISHAMNNVQIASKEAKLVGKAFVVDTNGNLIGPLDSEKRIMIPASKLSDISGIARRCGLSSMTIQKLLVLVSSTGSDKTTVQELAGRLNTTVRNANRIMLNLCRGGVAKPVYTLSSHSRGRPIQVYALDFGKPVV